MKAVEELRTGDVLRLPEGLCRVESVDRHAAVGKMAGAVFVRVRELATAHEHEKRFRPGEKVSDVPVERRRMQYLYSDADDHWFMDAETFEQMSVPGEILGERSRFLRPQMELPVELCEGSPVGVIFPDFVELRVATTAAPSRGEPDSVWKDAELDNGVHVLVPQFIKTGDVVRVDVRTGKYKDRAR
jgi:elongation factor P